MSQLRYITSEQESDSFRAKLFCAFHPNDITLAREIMQDMTSVLDCTVFYYDNGKPYGAYEDTLSQMSLFVFIVSPEFLLSPSFARDTVYPYAVAHMLPVLPIVTETGLDAPFATQFGNAQYILLGGEQYDVTAIPYLEKLKNHLAQIFSQSEDRKHFRDAFDTGLFLSYRKKDRHYAQELMQLIHRDPRCQGISIWYDEFLTPGEDFNSSIARQLQDSDMVLLVVTPHITEENNYILLTEYPAAMAEHKTVLPFEMCHTSRRELKAAYPLFPKVLPARNVTKAILANAKKLGISLMETSDEKEYLRGLAYLKGICVEKNVTIGAQKLLSAAESGVPQAMQSLFYMYKNGEGVEVSCQHAALWQKRYIAAAAPEEQPKAYLALGELYEQTAQYNEAIEAYENAATLGSGELQIEAQIKAGTLYLLLGDHFSARHNCFTPALEARKQQYEEGPSLSGQIGICQLYTLLARCCELCDDRVGVREYAIRLKKTLPPEPPEGCTFPLMHRLLVCNNKLGQLYTQYFEDKTHEAYLCIGNAIAIAKRLVRLWDCYASRCLLTEAYINDGDQHAGKKTPQHLHFAEEAYENARREAEAMEEKYTASLELKRILARITQKRAFVALEQADTDTACSLYQKAVDAFRQARAALDTVHTRRELHGCLQAMGGLYDRQGKDALPLLQEALSLAEENRESSPLAVYKKEEAAIRKLLAEAYKKQWDMDNAFLHINAQVNLLREAVQSTHRLGDIRLFAASLEQALPVSGLAGEFDAQRELQAEYAQLLAQYKDYL